MKLFSPEQISGLTLELPATWHYTGGLEGSYQEGARLVLGAFDGNVTLEFSRAGAE